MSVPTRIKMPDTGRGRRVPDKFICDQGHLHPSYRHAVKCNKRARKRGASTLPPIRDQMLAALRSVVSDLSHQGTRRDYAVMDQVNAAIAAAQKRL